MIKLDKLLKLSPDLICTLDIEGRFVDVSEASLSLLGYLPAELTGKCYRNFIDLADMPLADKAMRNLISGETLQIQNHYIHNSGKVIPLRWSAHWDDDDQLIYAIARSGEITNREEDMRTSLEESILRYQYVSKATSDAIWDWDIAKGTLYWGENFESIFGYKLSEISSGVDSWTSHIHEDDLVRINKSIQEILQEKNTNWKEEYRYQRADGTFADVVDRGFVIRDKMGIAIRMVGAMHDISERKQALKEMKRITDDLYKHNRELHEFGYIVSHNLRSPVTNIIGIATLLEMEQDDPETVSYCSTHLKTSISRLDEVILDLSKILNATDNSVELIAEPVNLSETIFNIETDLADKMLRNHVRIDVSPGLFIIHSHKAYVYSIFFNLITNAIKYRSESDPVISVKFVNKGAMVNILFTDNGLGIDLKRYGDDLFKPYKRFHTDIEGKGLGMFLVKSHIETLKGDINVTSKPGAGTTFHINLPKVAGFN